MAAHALSISLSIGSYHALTANTSHGVSLNKSSATLPRKECATPVRPCVLTMTMSAWRLLVQHLPGRTLLDDPIQLVDIGPERREESRERLKIHGANPLPEKARRGVLVRFLLHFHNIQRTRSSCRTRLSFRGAEFCVSFRVNWLAQSCIVMPIERRPPR